MEHRRIKISDPDYAHLSVAKLNELCTNMNSQSEVARRTAQSSGLDQKVATGGITRTQPGTIEAADILNYFCSQDHPAERKRTEERTQATPPERQKVQLASVSKTEPGKQTRIQAEAESPKQAYSLKEAAELLNLNWRSILGLVAVGQLSTEENGEGLLSINSKSLHAFRESAAARPGQTREASQPDCEKVYQPEPTDTHYEAINAAPEAYELFSVEPTEVTPPPAQMTVTAPVNIHELVDKLSDAQSQLEAASYRIGILESELATTEQKVRLLPDLQNHELRLSALERENRSLRLRLEELEQQKPPSLIEWMLSLVKRSSRTRHIAEPVIAPEPPPFNYRRARRDFR
jgi:hypothetical protein